MIEKFPSLDRACADSSEGCDGQLPTHPRHERLSATSSKFMMLHPLDSQIRTIECAIPGKFRYLMQNAFQSPHLCRETLYLYPFYPLPIKERIVLVGTQAQSIKAMYFSGHKWYVSEGKSYRESGAPED